MTLKIFVPTIFILFILTSCESSDNCYKKYKPLTKLSTDILEDAEQIFINSNDDKILIMNVADFPKYNYHVLHFDQDNKLKDETHISSCFIDSITNNTIFSKHQRIEGWAATEERVCKTDSVGPFKIKFNNFSQIGSNQYCKNIVDSISIDTSFLVHVYYRTRPKEAYIDIKNIIEADSILTEKHNRLIHINNLNFDYGEFFSIGHHSICTSDNSLFIKFECFKPKNATILPRFYKQLYDMLER